MLKNIIIKEISYHDPILLAVSLPEEKNFVFFDSSSVSNSNRYSFIAYDPFSIVTVDEGRVRIDDKIVSGEVLNILTNIFSEYRLPALDDIPFSGGLAGYIGYEFVNYLDKKITLPTQSDQSFQNMVLGLFDLVVAYDHILKKSWILSSGYPEKNSFFQSIRARERCQDMLEILKNISSQKCTEFSEDYEIEAETITSNFSYKQYCSKVGLVKEFISAGDIYQANISQRFSCALHNLKPLQLYKKLRLKNPAPFSSYVNLNGNILASASPERFIRLNKKNVVTTPIKGTIKRSEDKVQDAQLARRLLESEKDRAENLMIVDLLRNDLSRVCELQSVHVPTLFKIESFTTVHHLVSTVTGKLRENLSAIDLIAATFPGGSITGAPKHRAMQIISQLEPIARGPYCGSIGYFGFDGTMDTSITIRTFAIKNNKITFHVGSGIVADSCPHEEYLETLIKAESLYMALTGKSIFSLEEIYC